MNRTEPTYSAEEAAELIEVRGVEWVRKAAVRESIGRGKPRRYTRQDLAKLRKLVKPEETRGRPRRAQK